MVFGYRPLTFYEATFHPLHLTAQLPIQWSYNPGRQAVRFGLFRFRSPLLTESHSLSFPPLTEMFHFSGFALPAYEFNRKGRDITRVGLPHSEIPGSQRASRSPRLIVGSHVLRRRSAPRHPPCALCSFFVTISLELPRLRADLFKTLAEAIMASLLLPAVFKERLRLNGKGMKASAHRELPPPCRCYSDCWA